MKLKMKAVDNGLNMGYFKVIIEGVYLVPKSHVDRNAALMFIQMMRDSSAQ